MTLTAPTTYCLDTNIVVDLLRNDSRAAHQVGQLEARGATLVITPVTVWELYKGAYGAAQVEAAVVLVDQFVETAQVLDATPHACKIFARLCKRLHRSGRTVDDGDLLIAAIAREHNATVVTRDQRHFTNTGALLEVW